MMTSSMTRRSVLTEDDVLAVVRDWFTALNSGADAEELLRLVAEDGLVLGHPGGTLRDRDEVRDWWEAGGRLAAAPRCVPADVTVRLTSPLHADVTMSVNDTTEHWSLVMKDGVPLIRTRAVHPRRGA
jgi:hypothetical protein